MLKITAIDDNGRRTLVLEGRLVDPWVAELERTWSEAHDIANVSVDLKDVTAISDQGELLLRKMMSEGATFHCCRGILTKHVIRRLMDKCSGKSRNRV